ncbi:regulatory YrvL family protein [Oceanobacillus sp. Castelsardo]|uniref:regulatory YrvL family protein n=1 Tax=Oceanobacillus sp. Castelsardo TaxID=1851204 RepID=UPI0008388BC6|nr:regulatory YrvL family protein [Oceanobacillus sp. Castelsardo]
MPEHKNDSFRDMNRKEKISAVAGITLLIILVIGFIFGLYFFGLAGVFKVLGVQYESIWSLVIFVISFFIIGIIVEVFFKVIFKLSVRNITGKTKVLFIRIIVESTTNWLVLFTVDELMNSITLSPETEIIIALFLAVFEIVFDDKKDEVDNKNSAA